MQLTQPVRRAVQVHPGHIATIQGSRRHTWAEFAQRVASLASVLQERGLTRGGRVALLALNSDRYLEAFYAAVWAGGAIVPINFRFSPVEIVHCLSDCGAEILLVDDNFQPMASELFAQSGCVKSIIFMGESSGEYETLIASVRPLDDAGRGGDDLAGIFYTGGTTGKSKGVMLSHDALVSIGLNGALELRMDQSVIYLHAAPMFHAADIAMSLPVMQVAGTHVFVPRFDPKAVLENIAEHRVSFTLLVPTMIQYLLQQLAAAPADISSLKYFLYGASPMPQALLERAMAALPHVDFYQGYGMTEAVPATILSPQHHKAGGARVRSAGRATYFAEVKVVDPSDRELSRGTVGEILIRGPMMMQGYWNQPKLSEDALRGGWMHTGDAGYMDEEGFVFVVDRLKDMIISGGENVFSAETENAIYQHPAVAMCAVIGIPHEEWGEQVHAVVLLKDGHQLTADELLQHCRKLIAGYKCPRSVEFTREPLPVSGVGKILKRQLRDRYKTAAK
jgi:acyl-CoA synthetase (AMP-forming)/AMP-acid ligase II